MKKTILNLLLATLILGATEPVKAGTTLNWGIATAVCGAVTGLLYHKASKLNKEFNKPIAHQNLGKATLPSTFDYKRQLTFARDAVRMSENVNSAGLHRSPGLKTFVEKYNNLRHGDDFTVFAQAQTKLATELDAELKPLKQQETSIRRYRNWGCAAAWTTGILGFFTLCSLAKKTMAAEGNHFRSNPPCLQRLRNGSGDAAPAQAPRMQSPRIIPAAPLDYDITKDLLQSDSSELP